MECDIYGGYCVNWEGDIFHIQLVHEHLIEHVELVHHKSLCSPEINIHVLIIRGVV